MSCSFQSPSPSFIVIMTDWWSADVCARVTRWLMTALCQHCELWFLILGNGKTNKINSFNCGVAATHLIILLSDGFDCEYWPWVIYCCAESKSRILLSRGHRNSRHINIIITTIALGLSVSIKGNIFSDKSNRIRHEQKKCLGSHINIRNGWEMDTGRRGEEKRNS